MIKKFPLYGLLLAVGVSCQTNKAVPAQANPVSYTHLTLPTKRIV